MPTSAVFRAASRLLPPLCLIGTVYVYLYPVLHQCRFGPATAAVPGAVAPFRLLVFADPQLEGDSSLPGHGRAELFPCLKRIWHDVEQQGLGSLATSLSVHGSKLWTEDVPTALRTYRKQLDLWGNDLYLAHIYRSMRWYAAPTHVAVLGDLLGSQWIDDGEFARRSNRFWRTVFRGGQKVPCAVTHARPGRAHRLGADAMWKHVIITVPGNHDIGYAGDIDQHRIERFEHAYNRVNWDVRFALNHTAAGHPATLPPSSPEIRLVVLNSMNLDGPAAAWQPHQESVDFLNQTLYHHLPAPDAATILLTHIPLHKEAGICVDGPYIDHLPDHQGGGIKEQNHLSPDMTARILDGMVGPERARPGLILTGHDHAGCDVYHSTPNHLDPAAPREPRRPGHHRWHAQPYARARRHRLDRARAGVREITVRSMMGAFGGNAGLLSASWDPDARQWRFDYAACLFGVQHIWWAVHVVDLLALGLAVAGLASRAFRAPSRPRPTTETEEKKREEEKKKKKKKKKKTQ